MIPLIRIVMPLYQALETLFANLKGILISLGKLLEVMQYDDKYNFTDSFMWSKGATQPRNGGTCVIEYNNIGELL